MNRPLYIALLAIALSVTLATRLAFAGPGDVTLTTPTVACPKSQVGDGQLQSQYDEMWERYDRAVARESKAVEAEIGRLYDNAKAKGNLDLVIFWDGLKKSFADAGKVKWETATQKKDWTKRFQGTAFPEDFTAVLRKCEAGYGEAKTELEDGYKTLIAELTKKDKLSEAQAIKSEMGSIWATASVATPRPEPMPPTPKPTPQSPKPTQQKPLLERLAGRWSHPTFDNAFYFDANGDFREEVKATGKVQSRGRVVVSSNEFGEIRLDNGFRLQVRPAGNDVLAVLVWEPSGQPAKGLVLERSR